VTLEIAPHLLTGFLLAATRSAAWLFIVPPLSSRIVPTQVKAGLAASLGIYAAPILAREQVPLEVGPLVMAAGFQIVLGIALGFLVLLLFQAVQSAGELIDVFGGLTVMPAFDPLSGQQASGFARIYQVLASTLLFSTGGHLLLMRGFLESFHAIGVDGLDFSSVQALVVDDLGRFMLAAVEIAAPLLAVTFLLEVGQGLITRAAPQMNVFLAVMPLKILIALVLMAIALPLLPSAVSTLVESGVQDAMSLVLGVAATAVGGG
jgi:flagellar biosynthetic protein FliR